MGRAAELGDLRRLVETHRLVTLTGAGGVGKTRLAQRLAEQLATEFADGLCWVDLAPVIDPDLVADRIAHTLGLPEQPGHSAAETLTRLLPDRRMLMVLDNCEHLLDGCASVTATLLGACAGLAILATSREPIGVPGELTWPTPSLSLIGDAVELFTQRARLVQPDFTADGANAALVADVCRRLDGMPLAIELAASRVRALSLTEIVDGLHECLQLLTSGLRTAVPRQRTLRASVDWSHALLSEPEQVVFRRLALFLGGFDRAAATAVVGDTDLPRSQIIDVLTRLVDKSLVVADSTGSISRYRMLETVRQYALEKLDESDESDALRARHRDHYAAMFGHRGSRSYRWHVEHAEIEIDNLRAAFGCSRERGDTELAARLASSLLPLWIHSRILEGLAWFDAVLADSIAAPSSARARALTDKVILAAVAGDYYQADHAEQAVEIARGLDDPGLLAWALTGCGFTNCYRPQIALPYFAAAIELSTAMDDDWRLSQIYDLYAYSAFIAGDPAIARTAAEKGQQLAGIVGDWSTRRRCDFHLGASQILAGEFAQATSQGKRMAAASRPVGDPWFSTKALLIQAIALARLGDAAGARAAAEASIEAAADLVAFHRAISLGALVDAHLAAGNVSAALAASNAACDQYALPQLLAMNGNPIARAALASGDLTAARRWADDALTVASGAHRLVLLELLVRIAIAEGDGAQADRHARDALAIAAETGAYPAVPDVIECLATRAADSGSHREAARLFGSAAGIRDRTGEARFKVYDNDYHAAVDRLRDAMGQHGFETLWAEGAALSAAAAVDNARRSRDRPSEGWASLTPAELNIARLVTEGLRSKDIAAKLFISPRTVESHLSHIYRKLGASSRVQLAQEVARNS